MSCQQGMLNDDCVQQWQSPQTSLSCWVYPLSFSTFVKQAKESPAHRRLLGLPVLSGKAMRNCWLGVFNSSYGVAVSRVNPLVQWQERKWCGRHCVGRGGVSRLEMRKAMAPWVFPPSPQLQCLEDVHGDTAECGRGGFFFSWCMWCVFEGRQDLTGSA